MAGDSAGDELFLNGNQFCFKLLENSMESKRLENIKYIPLLNFQK
jgi:hypothetical protein